MTEARPPNRERTPRIGPDRFGPGGSSFILSVKKITRENTPSGHGDKKFIVTKSYSDDLAIKNRGANTRDGKEGGKNERFDSLFERRAFGDVKKKFFAKREMWNLFFHLGGRDTSTEKIRPDFLIRDE